MNLSQLPNIGKVLEKHLRSIGLTTKEELQSLGSIEVWSLLEEAQLDPCINTLYALEGAIRGVRWHDISKNERENLKNKLEF